MSKGFDELLTFPTTFVFRIIANNNKDHQESYKKVLQPIFSVIDDFEVLPSTSGRFVRVHITVMAKNAEQIYAGYEALKPCEGIKMVF